MLYKQVSIIAITFLAFLGLTAAAKRSRGQRCSARSECVDGLDCVDYWGDCGAECLCPGDINHDLTVFVRDQCYPRLHYGQVCEHNAQCAYTGGLCVSGICKCQQDKKHQDGGICGVAENRRLGESCLPSNNWCYYVDAQSTKQRGSCVGEPARCACPARYVQDGAKCIKMSGSRKVGATCDKSSAAEERSCEAGLYCRRCHSAGAYVCREIGGTNGIQASVALLLTMLVAGTLKI